MCFLDKWEWKEWIWIIKCIKVSSRDLMIQKYKQSLLPRERKIFLSKSGYLKFQDHQWSINKKMSIVWNHIGKTLKVFVSFLMCMLIRIPFNNQSGDRMICSNLKGNIFWAMFHFPHDRRTGEVVANILPSLARVLPLTLESCQKQETYHQHETNMSCMFLLYM